MNANTVTMKFNHNDRRYYTVKGSEVHFSLGSAAEARMILSPELNLDFIGGPDAGYYTGLKG